MDTSHKSDFRIKNLYTKSDLHYKNLHDYKNFLLICIKVYQFLLIFFFFFRTLPLLKSIFYREYAGKALFLLGLLAFNRDEMGLSKEYFLKAIAYPYRLKSCFLYLAHYYAVTPQDTIILDLKKNNPQKKRTENKNIAFDYYYDKYKTTPYSQEEKDIFLKKPYQHYLLDIEEYKRIREAQEEK